MPYYKLLFAVALLLLVLIFTLQNAQPVSIRFLFWEKTAAQGTTILLILLVGMIIGWLARAQVAHHRRKG